MHFHSLMFSEMTRYRCQMRCCCTIGRVPQIGKGTGLLSPVRQGWLRPGLCVGWGRACWGMVSQEPIMTEGRVPKFPGLVVEVGVGGPKLFSTTMEVGTIQGTVIPWREYLGKCDGNEREGFLFYYSLSHLFHSGHNRLFTVAQIHQACSLLLTLNSGTLFPQRTIWLTPSLNPIPCSNLIYAAHSFKNIPHSLSYY